MLVSAFTLKLGYKIEPGTVVVGKFDGKNPSLAYATTGGKILLHCPHESQNNSTGEADPTIKFLNFNRKVTSLCCGSFQKNSGKSSSRDYLFVGTSTNVLAYDVERNADVFFRDVQDGANTMMIGSFGTYSPLLMVGGNCSVVGFDEEGSEAFWTVTGDNISAITVSDVNSDGIPELLVGSDDFEIRVFRDEELLEEITEAEKITFLHKLEGDKFLYGLSNGTVGVHSGSKGRLWRVKTKNLVTAVSSFDVNGDGINEILIGWNNGTFHVRNPSNGDLMFKDKLSSTIAGIVVSDYRKDGKEVIIVCAELGDIIAYIPADVEALSGDNNFTNLASAEDMKAISELHDKKLELTNELKSLEKTVKLSKSTDAVSGGLLSNTSLNYTLYPDMNHECLALKVEVTPSDVMIVNVIAIDSEGGILNGCEVLAVTPSITGKPAVILFHPTKYNACSIRVQTHVAARGSTSQLHVFEKDVNIPKFATFLKLPDKSASTTAASLSLILGDVVPTEPTSKVVFRTNESTSRITDWVNSAFLLPQAFKCGPDSLRLNFLNVCYNSTQSPSSNLPIHRQPLHIHASKDDADGTLMKVTIRCDTMDLASEVIQDMSKFLKISEISSQADFSEELKNFETVLNTVTECNSARIQLAADMADESQLVKALIVRAEDSRLLVDMKSMRRAYTELFSLNNQLISNYNLRANNHESLMSSLKDVNVMIQKSANLRVGKAKATLISDCRSAVKANDMQSLLRIIHQGYDASENSVRK